MPIFYFLIFFKLRKSFFCVILIKITILNYFSKITVHETAEEDLREKQEQIEREKVDIK